MAKQGRPLHTEYPSVISKLDPLMIRVSETVLLVGSASYTAKIKMGQLFNGFYVYVSSVGTPIFKEAVDITYHSTESDNNHGEGSDAWRYITTKARDWMDDLEESMQNEDAQKNIVDLLREMKYQEHYDETGQVIDRDYRTKYGDNFEFVENQPSYASLILEQLTVLNGKVDALDKAVRGDTDYKGLNDRVSSIETTLTDTIDSSIDAIKGSIDNIDAQGHKLDNIREQLVNLNKTTNGSVAKLIADSITQGLTQLVGEINDLNTTAGVILDCVREEVSPNVYETIIARAGTILTDSSTGIPSINNKLTDVNTGLGAINTNVTNTNTNVTNRTVTIQNDVGGTLYQNVSDIKSDTRNATYGLAAIKYAVGSSGGDVSSIAAAVGRVETKVNTMTPQVQTCYEVVFSDSDSLYGIICKPSTRALS